ncbi:MAG: histone deacetylase [bacterium]|nr:histone deacetylase [bacterium]
MLKIAYSPIYQHALPDGHRFPMLKYELIPLQLLRNGLVDENNFFEPLPILEEHILLTHTAAYWKDLKTLTLDPKIIRKIGFPLSEELVIRERIITQGTIDCALYAMQYGAAFNIAGGTHHAYADSGEGFCLLNDCAIASNYLLKRKLVSQVLIIDLDVHQGQGTASIFKNNRNVFTLSMHGKDNYPLHKEQSDIDIELKTGCDGTEYLKLLEAVLIKTDELIKPDIVFYVAGVDVLLTDKMGKLKLTIQECKHRDEMVFKFCKARNLPVVVTMGGGYSPEISDIVDAHCNTFEAAIETIF